MELWQGKCPKKVNPLTRIKKVVEAYHLNRDLEEAKKGNCIYRKAMKLRMKKYIFEEKLKEPGRFKSTVHRKAFLYAWLDASKYERECKNCGKLVKDIVRHGLEKCERVEHQRKVYLLKMQFYDVPKRLNLLSKTEVFEAVMAKNSLMQVLCHFLIVILKWSN